MNIENKNLFTRQEAANYIGVHRKYLDNLSWSDPNKIPFIKSGNRPLYHKKDLDLFKAQQLIKANKRKERLLKNPNLEKSKVSCAELESTAKIIEETQILRLETETQQVKVLQTIAKLISCLNVECKKLLVKNILDNYKDKI